jgi:hypothetical protein
MPNLNSGVALIYHTANKSQFGLVGTNNGPGSIPFVTSFKDIGQKDGDLNYALEKMSLVIQAPFDPALCEQHPDKTGKTQQHFIELPNFTYQHFTFDHFYIYTTTFDKNPLITFRDYDTLSTPDLALLKSAGFVAPTPATPPEQTVGVGVMLVYHSADN